MPNPIVSQSVNPSSSTQPLSGQVTRQDDFDTIIRNLQKRVTVLEQALATLQAKVG